MQLGMLTLISFALVMVVLAGHLILSLKMTTFVTLETTVLMGVFLFCFLPTLCGMELGVVPAAPAAR